MKKYYDPATAAYVAYQAMDDQDLLKVLDDAHDWADLEVEPCFRVLCDRHGIDYDEFNFDYYGCDGLYDLLVERCQAN